MDSKRYLAEQVLNERQTVSWLASDTCWAQLLIGIDNQVTYRSLSRALKIHAHRAKQSVQRSWSRRGN